MTEINPLWKVWNEHPVQTIIGTKYTLKGFSIAALRTNFYIPELGIMLDAGLSGNMSPSHIFITHGHCDHTANIPYHLMGVPDGTVVKIYAPTDTVKYVEKYMKSAYCMSNSIDEHELTLKKTHDMIPVKGNQTIDMNIRGKDFVVEIINCHHSVPCVGYGFTEKKKKLDDKYTGLSGKELVELKKKGVDINKEVLNHIFCFLGDTDHEVLKDPMLNKYKNIMIECTFIDDADVEQAAETKHIHWKNLAPYIETNKDTHFILYHFSQRYKRQQIRDFFDKLALKNVTAWISN